ncbi:paralemmin-2-like [Hippocampus zosterae]|uniref:paralemmin-2-like n=1 Tax=Hippocampus zosterae TaxID=109293 RepID=UPI00223D231D|nr:paralemmin-2-like [Hippocampus zosterae]XP_051904792.1 paralemmin-2-like [Hippocampus zosterae]XP_051904793.1 paralemmin-2-like [Hippocampus zosterae]XP_051904794.1 paralemmin-2-like [Hippocampus zosterae]
MAQRQVQESGKDGRSVLGMLTVQVERDPKTGASVVKSVAPASAPDSRPPASAIFDGDPSTEELGQIFSAADGVGMRAMLDEVTVTLNEADPETADAEAGGGPFKPIQAPVNRSAAKENPGRPESEDKMTREVSRLSARGEERANATVVRDAAGKEVTVEDRVLEQSPITLVFLGYADSTAAQETPDMLIAERVLIADDGEEPRVANPEESESEMDRGAPQMGKDQTSQVQEDHAHREASSATVEERKGPSKRKTCHCCSVM